MEVQQRSVLPEEILLKSAPGYPKRFVSELSTWQIFNHGIHKPLKTKLSVKILGKKKLTSW